MSESNKTMWHLFHALWSKAVGTSDYDKKQWLELEREILRQSGKATP